MVILSRVERLYCLEIRCTLSLGIKRYQLQSLLGLLMMPWAHLIALRWKERLMNSILVKINGCALL
jgi:nucleoside permease NupC